LPQRVAPAERALADAREKGCADGGRARDRRSEYTDQICRAPALVEKPERIETEPIADL
jgi:hypothetical protein